MPIGRPTNAGVALLQECAQDWQDHSGSANRRWLKRQARRLDRRISKAAAIRLGYDDEGRDTNDTEGSA